jgi:hypothetical protein
LRKIVWTMATTASRAPSDEGEQGEHEVLRVVISDAYEAEGRPSGPAQRHGVGKAVAIMYTSVNSRSGNRIPPLDGAVPTSSLTMIRISFSDHRQGR